MNDGTRILKGMVGLSRYPKSRPFVRTSSAALGISSGANLMLCSRLHEQCQSLPF